MLRYIISLILAVIIFASAYGISQYFNRLRLADVQGIQTQIASDILASETQFDLVTEVPCSALRENPILSETLGELGDKLAYAEEQLGTDDERVLALKKQYTLLQIKDLILMRRVAERCAVAPTFILYFYSNKGDCPDCQKQGYVLTDLLQSNPLLRVYSFDYNLDLPVFETLKRIYKLKGDLPALVIDRTPHYGYQEQNDILKLLPTLKAATTTATSTNKTN